MNSEERLKKLIENILKLKEFDSDFLTLSEVISNVKNKLMELNKELNRKIAIVFDYDVIDKDVKEFLENYTLTQSAILESLKILQYLFNLEIKNLKKQNQNEQHKDKLINKLQELYKEVSEILSEIDKSTYISELSDLNLKEVKEFEEKLSSQNSLIEEIGNLKCEIYRTGNAHIRDYSKIKKLEQELESKKIELNRNKEDLSELAEKLIHIDNAGLSSEKRDILNEIYLQQVQVPKCMKDALYFREMKGSINFLLDRFKKNQDFRVDQNLLDKIDSANQKIIFKKDLVKNKILEDYQCANAVIGFNHCLNGIYSFFEEFNASFLEFEGKLKIFREMVKSDNYKDLVQGIDELDKNMTKVSNQARDIPRTFMDVIDNQIEQNKDKKLSIKDFENINLGIENVFQECSGIRKEIEGLSGKAKKIEENLRNFENLYREVICGLKDKLFLAEAELYVFKPGGKVVHIEDSSSDKGRLYFTVPTGIELLICAQSTNEMVNILKKENKKFFSPFRDFLVDKLYQNLEKAFKNNSSEDILKNVQRSINNFIEASNRRQKLLKELQEQEKRESAFSLRKM